MDREKIVAFWSILMLHQLSDTLYNAAHVISKHVELNESLLLECFEDDGKSTWEHEKDVIYSGKVNIGNLPRDTTELFGNYSLYIKKATVYHEGQYTCTRGSNHMVYQITVKGLQTFI